MYYRIREDFSHILSLERTPREARKSGGVVLRGRSARGCYAAIGAKGDRYEENVIRLSAHTFDCSMLVCGTTTDNHSGAA